MMTVNVLLSGRLSIDGYGRSQPLNGDGTFRLALKEGSSMQDVIGGMGVPSEKVTLTMLNGRQCPVETALRPGDKVILIPQDVAILWRALHTQNLGMGIGFDR
jgi:hypothetical protein